MTKEMIEAGKAAYWGHFPARSDFKALDQMRPSDYEDCFTNQIVAIYEAMREAE